MGAILSKGTNYKRVAYTTNINDDETWLRSPMCVKNCEPLEVPDTDNLVFYSKRDFYPVVIQTQSEEAMLNTVLYLEKGLREYCLCNVKNTLKISIIDVIDQGPAIERVKLGGRNYIYVSFLPGPFSYVRRKSKRREITVSRRVKLADRIRNGPVTRDRFITIVGEPSCKGNH
jgi:hypothetical protein